MNIARQLYTAHPNNASRILYRMWHPIKFPYNLNGQPITRSTAVKDLGVTFDSKLTFNVHITSVAKESFRRLGFVLRNVRDFRSSHVIKLLYCALVRSKLEASSCVWHPHESTYTLLLEKVQKAFLRFLYKHLFGYYPYMYPTKFLMGCLGYNSLEVRRANDQLITMCKVLRGKIDAPDLHDDLARLYVPDNYYRNRRHRLFQEPSCRTVAHAQSPIPRTLSALNDLLNENPECDVFVDGWKEILSACLKFCEKFSSSNYEAAQSTQPQVQEEKFDFEDLQIQERTDRRKPKISPFMKDVFVSIFNRDMLAYPEIMTKDESEDVDRRVQAITKIFHDPQKTKSDRREILKRTKMFSAPVNLTNNGLAMNYTECLRYLEIIGEDFELGQEISDHWVGLEALKHGLSSEQFNGVVDDLTMGEKTISLCIKERVAERLTQADFRTSAVIDEQGVWRVSGEKVCNKVDGYLLVLASVEGSRLKAFLIHPQSHGVDFRDGFVDFNTTPATPLDNVTEARLAQILATSRLHAASLCRTRLRLATFAVVDYVAPRAFSGKPLSELSLIRSTIGGALLDMYASESAEYLAAGLLDAYESPDAEMELAMCRNFMANHGLSTMLKLLAIPALDKETECRQMFDDMRHLTARGETLDNINMYIAMTGIHHAGVTMAEEIKQIRNPLLHPAFIFKKAFFNRHQENDDPKLTLYLAEHLHPSLRLPSEQLEYCVLRMRFGCETIMARHGKKVATAYTELARLAEAGTEILAMTAVLARASRSYCIGVRNAEIEMKLSASFVDQSKDKVRRLIKEIDDGEFLNRDHFMIEFGRKVFETHSLLVEKPTTRVFW